MKPSASVWRVLLVLAVGACLAQPAVAKKTDEEPVAKPQPRGLLIGRFVIRDLRATEGAKIRLSFALYGETDEEQVDRLRTLLESHKNRARDAVLTAVRTCEQGEFQDPDLRRFRRRIELRLHRTTPVLAFNRLLIGEFEYFVE